MLHEKLIDSLKLLRFKWLLTEHPLYLMQEFVNLFDRIVRHHNGEFFATKTVNKPVLWKAGMNLFP